MRVVALAPRHLDPAARLVAAGVAALARAVPAAPTAFADPAAVRPRLDRHFDHHPGLAAEADDGRLVGFLGWFVAPHFRNTDRTAAYVPDWCHGFAADRAAEAHRALYAAAAAIWTAAGCATHAVTLPATADVERGLWFAAGFGLVLVDVVGWTGRDAGAAPTGVTIRRATTADAAAIARLDAALSDHLAAPPTLTRRLSLSAAACAARLADPDDAAWIAVADDAGGDSRPVGFLRVTAGGDGAAFLRADGVVTVNGAHVEPAWRGRGVGTALLAAARDDLAARGVRRCHAEFESSNPEAAAFWPRQFTPAAMSLVRVTDLGAAG
jgi:ribosomal protein S18 acetylase RimI-like enzyme